MQSPLTTPTVLIPQERRYSPLPASALLKPELAIGSCQWLDEYERLSLYFSPRSYDDFHTMVGVWVLSTVAGGRIKFHHGSQKERTSLFLAMVAPSTFYAKTTAASIGIDVLNEAGLSWRLSPQEITPQRLVGEMSGLFPDDYQFLEEEQQAEVLRNYAMSGQRGWFCDEFGQQLDQMMNVSSTMSNFRSLLRRLDDNQDLASSATWSRGCERIEYPYVALLASMTPVDMRPYARRGARLWHDGLFSRFAFATPPQNSFNEGRRPDEPMIIPAFLTASLRNWHAELGEPEVMLDTRLRNDKVITTARRGPFPQQICRVGPGVFDALHNYQQGLMQILVRQDLTDLSNSYGRFPAKALRLAMLFASLENGGLIEIKHLARAQQITESWRVSLHELYHQINTLKVNSSSAQEEDEMIELIKHLTQKFGLPPTLRDMARYCRRYDTPTIREKLSKLVMADVLSTITDEKQKTRYTYVQNPA